MLQVWPSISMPQVGVLLQRLDRLVERARRFRPQRVAVEVEVHVLEDDLLARRPDHLDRDRIARRAALAVGHRDGDRHGPFLHRRRPRRLPSVGCGERARPARSTCRSAGRRRDRCASAVTVDVLPTSTVHGSQRAVTVGGRFAARRRRRRWRRRRRRRHVDAHARVIADAALEAQRVAGLVFERAEVAAAVHLQALVEPGAGEDAVLALPGQPERGVDRRVEIGRRRRRSIRRRRSSGRRQRRAYRRCSASPCSSAVSRRFLRRRAAGADAPAEAVRRSRRRPGCRGR